MDFDIATGIVTFIERGKDTVLAGINDVNRALSGVGNVNVRVSFSDLLVQLGSVDAAVQATQDRLRAGLDVSFNAAEVARFTGSLEASADAQARAVAGAQSVKEAIDEENQSLREGQSLRRSGNLNINQNSAQSINRISASAAALAPAGATVDEFTAKIRELAASGNFDINVDTQQLVRSLGITRDEANQTVIALGQLQNVRGRINDGVDRIAAGSSRGFNNVGFQIGQAIEDGAVGASLNGIQGAIRGAGNNVSFLANQFASTLNPEIATTVSLATGVGVAALIAAQPIADWVNGVEEAREEVTRVIRELSRLSRIQANIARGGLDLDFRLQDAVTQEDINRGVLDLQRQLSQAESDLEISDDARTRLYDELRSTIEQAAEDSVLIPALGDRFGGRLQSDFFFDAVERGAFGRAAEEFLETSGNSFVFGDVVEQLTSLNAEIETAEGTSEDAAAEVERLADELKRIGEESRIAESRLDSLFEQDRLRDVLLGLNGISSEVDDIARRRPASDPLSDTQRRELERALNLRLDVSAAEEFRDIISTPLDDFRRASESLNRLRGNPLIPVDDINDAAELIRLNFESDIESLRSESITGRGAIDDLASAIQDAALDRESLAEQRKTNIILERIDRQRAGLAGEIANELRNIGVIN